MNTILKEILAGARDSIVGVLAMPDTDYEKIEPATINALIHAQFSPWRQDSIEKMVLDMRQDNMSREVLDMFVDEMVIALQEMRGEYDVASLSAQKQAFFDAICDEFMSILREASSQYGVYDLTITWKRLHDDAILPAYTPNGGPYMTLYAPEDITVPANARLHLLDTGWSPSYTETWALSHSAFIPSTTLRIVGTYRQPGTGALCLVVDNSRGTAVKIIQGQDIGRIEVRPAYRALNRIGD